MQDVIRALQKPGEWKVSLVFSINLFTLAFEYISVLLCMKQTNHNCVMILQVLVVDQLSSRIISSCCKMHDIVEEGITSKRSGPILIGIIPKSLN